MKDKFVAVPVIVNAVMAIILLVIGCDVSHFAFGTLLGLCGVGLAYWAKSMGDVPLPATGLKMVRSGVQGCAMVAYIQFIRGVLQIISIDSH